MNLLKKWHEKYDIPMIWWIFKQEFWWFFFRIHLDKSDRFKKINSIEAVSLICDLLNDVFLEDPLCISWMPNYWNMPVKPWNFNQLKRIYSQLYVTLQDYGFIYVWNDDWTYLESRYYREKWVVEEIFFTIPNKENLQTLIEIYYEWILPENTFFTNKNFSSIIVPYDRGIDIIIFDEHKRIEIKNKYKQYVADGL